MHIIGQADRRAAWPPDMGLGFFDIVSVCVRRKSVDRPEMNQVIGGCLYVCLSVKYWLDCVFLNAIVHTFQLNSILWVPP